MKKLSLLLIVVLLTYACANVAGTNRKQLSLYSDEEVNTMSFASYQKDVVQSGMLSKNTAEVNLVRKVGNRIAKAAEIYMTQHGRQADLANFEWEFNLIEDPETVNAFCMPGGKVAFYSGILPICGDETGIAVVMGHEVAHALARHGNERISQQAAAGAVQNILLGTDHNIMASVFGVGANVGILLPFSRKHESEADEIGLYLMAIAGYDPSAAVDFWQRMADMKSGGDSSLDNFLSTHPSDQRRIDDLKKIMPEAQELYRTSTMR